MTNESFPKQRFTAAFVLAGLLVAWPVAAARADTPPADAPKEESKADSKDDSKEESKKSDGGLNEPDHKAGIILGAKVGGILPIDGLNPHVSVGIEAGYALPFLRRAFALKVDLDYAAPQKSGEETDPRIEGGKYTWHLTEQELTLMPLAMFRMPWFKRIVPFIGVGPRIYFLESTVRSNEGTPQFEETTEVSTKVGVGVPFGVEYTLGPGGLLFEVLFQYGGVDHLATGDANTGAFNVFAGYRFLL